MCLLKKLIYVSGSRKMFKLTITHLFTCGIRYQSFYIFAGERNLSGDDSRKKEKIKSRMNSPTRASEFSRGLS